MKQILIIPANMQAHCRKMLFLLLLSCAGLFSNSQVPPRVIDQPLRLSANAENIQLLSVAKPVNEVNCFSNFQPGNTGNCKINAYLLSLLIHYNYPRAISGNDDEGVAVNREMFQDETVFLRKYKDKVAHYFTNPMITSVNNGLAANGYDPEAVVISTQEFIIVVFRGTDRIAFKSTQFPFFETLNYEAGEWVNTDFDAVKINAPFSLPGQVHRGFNNSIQSILPRLADTLRKYEVGRKKLWITGHSLGGALAQLTAVYLKKQYQINAQGVYTYASPHVGDANFAAGAELLFPGTTIQRFEFMTDPAPYLPPVAMGYGRVGARNFYSKESGSNYFFNTNEFNGISLDFCFHNSEWYARAAYLQLTENNEAIKSSIPNCPPRPKMGCLADYHYKLADGMSVTEIANEALTDITNQISHTIGVVAANITGSALKTGTGTYKITCLKDGKNLAVSGTSGANGRRLILWQEDGGNNMRFEVFKKGAGYGLRMKGTNRVLDVIDGGVNNGDRIQIWDNNLTSLPLQNNQIWYLYPVGGNRYVLQNEKSKKVLDADNPNTGANGCEVMQWDYRQGARNQVWVFEKISN